MIDTIRRLHPVQHNVPAVWNEFEKAFRQKFVDVDSTGELCARNQLNKLKFKYPEINGHIAEFEDLIVKANYNLASQEVINLFLKGFSHSRNLLNKVFTPPVPETYEAMKKRMVAIVKSMQLVNSIAQNAPNFRPFQRNNQLLPPGKSTNPRLRTTTSQLIKRPTLDVQHASPNGHEQPCMHPKARADTKQCSTGREPLMATTTTMHMLQLRQGRTLPSAVPCT